MVSRRAGDWGGNDTRRRQTDIPRCPQHAVDSVLTECGIANEPLPDAAPADLELRLDEKNEVGIRPHRLQQRRQHHPQRNERQVRDDQVKRVKF